MGHLGTISFVEGREVLNASVIANEAIDSILKSKERGALCKLDIEKPYDRLKWDFLLLVMQSMGFGKRWAGSMKWFISAFKSLQ